MGLRVEMWGGAGYPFVKQHLPTRDGYSLYILCGLPWPHSTKLPFHYGYVPRIPDPYLERYAKKGFQGWRSSLACIIHEAQDFVNQHLQEWENLCCRFRHGAFTPSSRLALSGDLQRPQVKPERFIIQKLPLSSWIVRTRKSITTWYFIFDSVIFSDIWRGSDRSWKW